MSTINKIKSTQMYLIESSTYTPTLYNTTNISASSASVCQYMRVGNVVNVSGRIQIDAISAAETLLGVSLPIASNITASTQCSGVGSLGARKEVLSIYGDSTNDRAIFYYTATDTDAQTWAFTFMYLVN